MLLTLRLGQPDALQQILPVIPPDAEQRAPHPSCSLAELEERLSAWTLHLNVQLYDSHGSAAVSKAHSPRRASSRS